MRGWCPRGYETTILGGPSSAQKSNQHRNPHPHGDRLEKPKRGADQEYKLNLCAENPEAPKIYGVKEKNCAREDWNQGERKSVGACISLHHRPQGSTRAQRALLSPPVLQNLKVKRDYAAPRKSSINVEIAKKKGGGWLDEGARFYQRGWGRGGGVWCPVTGGGPGKRSGSLCVLTGNVGGWPLWWCRDPWA